MILNRNRNYNVVYTLGSFILQIMQDGQHDGIAVGLLPQITLAINNRMCYFAVGFDWICGTLNIGVMTPDYRAEEKARKDGLVARALKQGITPKQEALKWGW